MKVTIVQGHLDRVRRERKFLPCGCLDGQCKCVHITFNSLGGKRFKRKPPEEVFLPPDPTFVSVFHHSGLAYLLQDDAFYYLKKGWLLKLSRKEFRLIDSYYHKDEIWDAFDVAKRLKGRGL